MAPSARTPASLDQYAKRERKAIVLLTLAFILVSAAVHFLVGAIYRPQQWKPDVAPQPHESMIVGVIDRRPTPTPPPEVTPPPRTPPPSVTATFEPTATSNPGQHPFASAPPLPGGGASPGPGDQVGASPRVGTETQPPMATTPPAFAPCRFVRKVEPDYPDAMKAESIQGTTAVIITINADGSVASVRVGESSGNATLDDAALAAARDSTYWCPPIDGRPAAEQYEVIYNFRLD